MNNDANGAMASADLSSKTSTIRTVPVNATLFAYGGLALPLCLALTPILIYLPAFYSQELHVSAGLVGMVFMAARLWDGFCDVLIGWLSDRTKGRFGRRKPWVIAGAPLLMGAT